VPEGEGHARRFGAQVLGEPDHIVATARAERPGGILFGGERMAVPDEVEQHFRFWNLDF
jgi:hypothetical protein